jgi:hypothetical protein
MIANMLEGIGAGGGAAGAIAAFPAIANAIADALAPFGATDLTGPATLRGFEKQSALDPSRWTG